MDAKKSMRHFYCRDTYWQVFETMASNFTVSVDYLINEAMRHYAKNKGWQGVDDARGAQMPGTGNDTATSEFAFTESAGGAPKAARALPKQQRRANSSGAFSLGADLFTIIGRVSKLCDLTIKDANISRKHAAVIKRNGLFYIKDLGSTNGIEYNGMRIDNKRIDEGDVFSLCENLVRFTFK